MKKTLCAATLTLMALPAWSQQPPSDATVEAHVNAATRAAGKDLESLLVLCKPAPVARPPQALVDKGIAAQIARPAPPPGQAFDNLYFVGAAWATAWALTTPEGIVIFDPLNNEQEAVTLIEGGLRKLGLDPARISHLVVSHGHGDHYGGAQYLIGKYKPRVVMSDLDWTMTETKLEFSSVHWGPPPRRDPTRDLSVKDGDLLTLGGAPILFPLTPGHTWGTVSPVFDVTWKGTEAPRDDLGRHGLQLRQGHPADGCLYRRHAAHGGAGEGAGRRRDDLEPRRATTAAVDQGRRRCARTRAAPTPS